jgi:dTDP-6-deoxy-L-talose 4-dehydrogenase (NAD+)
MIANGLKDLTVIGTCLEYGLREGMLSEDMTPLPVVSYAISKNRLREQLESFIEKYLVHFRWLRLFYMYGEGQHPNSLYPQLLKAIKEGATEFNMSGGEQERDFLPVAKVAENIVACALQAKVLGVINVCSGRPLKVKDFVQAIIKGEGSSLKMNLGFYPYSEYEPMCFWGCNSLMKLILITYGSN